MPPRKRKRLTAKRKPKSEKKVKTKPKQVTGTEANLHAELEEHLLHLIETSAGQTTTAKALRSPLELKSPKLDNSGDSSIWIANNESNTRLVEEQRKVYKWAATTNTYPHHIDDDNFPDVENVSIVGLNDLPILLQSFHRLVKSVSTQSEFKSIDEVPIYGRYAALLQKQGLSDECFGYFRIGGPNPFALTKVSTVDAKDSEPLQAGLQLRNSELDLKVACEQGNIFVENYQDLKVDCVHKDYIMEPARAFFYMSETTEPIPLAIQIDDKWSLPSDSTWAMAKLKMNGAYFLHHEIICHLILTHFVMEICLVSLHRNLPRTHPVAGLLLDHSYKTLAINRGARKSLVPVLLPLAGVPLSVSTQLISTQWWTGHLDFKKIHFLQQIKNQLGDDVKFQHWHYLHDALLLWNTLLEYHEAVLKEFYREEEFKDDYVQEWLTETSRKIPGMPCAGEVKTVAQLAEIITVFVFVAVVQHTTYNYSQADFYQAAHIFPSVIRHGSDVNQALPTKLQASVTYAIVTLLSNSPSANDNIWSGFGSYVKQHNQSGCFNIHIKKQVEVLQPKLKELAEIVDDRERNALGFKFDVLHPQRTAKSILI